MDGLELIRMRRSIRAYSDKPITDETLHKILEAAMSGPSCTNAQDWCFLVTRQRETLLDMARANGRPAEPLKTANAGILVCGDLNRSFQGAPDYWIIDGAIACQNIVLGATALGVGSVWLGTYPQMERVQAQKKLFSLPDNIVPHSVIALGYPADPRELALGSRSGYREELVHMEKW